MSSCCWAHDHIVQCGLCTELVANALISHFVTKVAKTKYHGGLHSNCFTGGHSFVQLLLNWAGAVVVVVEMVWWCGTQLDIVGTVESNLETMPPNKHEMERKNKQKNNKLGGKTMGYNESKQLRGILYLKWKLHWWAIKMEGNSDAPPPHTM